ncbi:MAG: 7,8-didemethyl-8-hydroxy-5-deazariboflavin synthase CofG [Oceanospirillaceae bacterium]|nr:7,8-didemethyl-8-hydroxy-5-deazariboflavin synthase CofG [Oceanospirillaceae bacterium]
MLSKSEAIALDGLTGEALTQLCLSATKIREQHWGARITYSRKVFVPLTNMCRDTCSYCTFVKHPDSPQAYIMSAEQVLKVVTDGQKMGCKEVLFSLGEKPERRYPQVKQSLANMGYSSMVDYLVDSCQMVIDQSQLLPHVNAGTLTLDEIRRLKPVSASMGMMLETVSKRLLVKGNVHYACPDKVPVQRLRTLERAGKLDVPFTTGILIGIGETWTERVESLIAINEIHQQYGHIQEVIVQNFCAKADTAMAGAAEPGLDDMRRTLAMARLILDPSISIQAPPNLQQRYSAYLKAGINDFGGISPLTLDHINPERSWPQISQLATACEANGDQLQERLAVYPKYQRNGDRYLAGEIPSRLYSMARADGLAAVQFH